MSTRPYLAPGLVALVVAGGAVGSVGRAALGQALPADGGWHWGTLAANALGAFLLGLLLEVLVRRGPESRRGRTVRLALGTGVMGGFTTYSTFAVEVERSLADGQVATALGYAATILVLGLVACSAGVLLGARLHRWRVTAREAT
ncbi:CrcB family protein [Actinotalea sp. M2MS4P-6]|uniref:fluoride efflux transporter FluC n=1 Tax=Actinotalea sp. M2MS4P-6 TaxID=2983762 RepID=UPI0021E3DB56|nr:CrcB family protein [Actinotalea sp. M2MS4P-6]MCV2396251.1 CrcB family protein [Actinotalea sp. M2MS4P-6]